MFFSLAASAGCRLGASIGRSTSSVTGWFGYGTSTSSVTELFPSVELAAEIFLFDAGTLVIDFLASRKGDD